MSQKKIFNFFQSTEKSNSLVLVKGILNDLVSDVIIKNSSKKHETVNDKTLEKWKQNYPWLIVSTMHEKKTLKCKLCSEFKTSTIWAKDGTTNIQKSTLDRHNECDPHIEACKLSIKKLDMELAPENKLEKGKIDNADVYLMRTVYMVMKEELPLDKVNAILELQRINKADISYRNLSWTTITEIQNLIALILKEDLIQRLRSSEYFAMLIDETTDVSISKRLSICVRYIHNGIPYTDFLANIELSDGCAHTIVTALLTYFEKCEINTSKCVSLATDGASVMVGKKTGVGVQLVAKAAPFCVQTHCVAHRLNLSITDAIKDNDAMKKFNVKFGELFNFFSNSGNRTYTLRQMQTLLDEPELSIKAPYPVRWLGLKRAVETVHECYGSLLATLSSIGVNDTKAKGLYKYFSSYKTAILIGLMCDVHVELGKLCCTLQSEKLMFSDVPAIVESTVSMLNILKTNDGECFKIMKGNLRYEEDKVFYGNEELTNYSLNIDSQIETVRQNYLSNLIKNIKRRIPKHDSKLMLSLNEVLEPSIVRMASPESNETALQCLIDHYGNDKVIKSVSGNMISGYVETVKPVVKIIQSEQLLKEWPGVCGMMAGCYKNLSLPEFCQRIILKHKDQFPNIAKLAVIALCMQVTSVECERSFSTQNRIKSKYRASLGDVSLEALMRVSLFGPSVENFDSEQCARQWLTKRRRKKRLTAEYKPREPKRMKLTKC
ncbi:zinc finger protein 862-like [Ruditapes philippinarum]|uniref:zinc finger protein 862-like n=1 Tax=Ruditapes philippinarum TaxID=129788 RepID=UPI00295B9475|nr:zinc finger protein 862-like [Ruditapes philippinarum]